MSTGDVVTSAMNTASIVGHAAASQSKLPKLVVIGLACALPPGLAILYAIPPMDNALYPKCPLHEWTGLHCPGCGCTRALYALVHGDLAQAVAFNPLFIISLPWLLWLGLRASVAILTDSTIQGSAWSLWVFRVWLFVAVLFSILRNVPLWPLEWLAPHTL